jgi:hypothetical protein
MMRFGSIVIGSVLLFVIGAGLVFWGLHILPEGPLRVAFVAAVALVCLVVLIGMAREPRGIQHAYTRARPAQIHEHKFLTAPLETPIGRCWQCGARVRRWNTVCFKCGATQMERREAAAAPPPMPGHPSVWEAEAPFYSVPLPAVPPGASAPLYRPMASGWPSSFAEPALAAEAWPPLPPPELPPE